MNKDNRYTIHREYCGHSVSKVVVRFCGEFIGQCDTIEEAMELEKQHNKERVAS